MTPTPEERKKLLDATRLLSTQVENLTSRVAIGHRQSQRTRLLTWLALASTALCLVAIVVTGVLIGQVHDATGANKNAQVVTCLSANESRAASLKLWLFLIGQSKAETHQEVVALAKLETWIKQLYQPHDCSDLTKPVHIPPPPDLGLNGK